MLNDFLDQILIFPRAPSVGLFLAVSCSQHFFFLSLSPGLWEKWKEGRRRGGWGEQEEKQLEETKKEKKKEKENAFNLFTITVLCWFLAECRVFLSFSRTCLCTQRSEGCWLTANSNCPEAKGSHFQTGSFIFPWKRKWSLALILNHPPAAVYKVIREALWQTDSRIYADTETE